MESIQQIFELISVFPTSDKVKPKIKFRNHLIAISLFSIELLCIGASVAFFIKFVLIDLENALFAFSQISAYGSAAYEIAVGYKQRKFIAEIIIEFQAIRYKYPSKFIEEANRRGEFLTKVFMKYLLLGWCVIGLALTGITYIYCLIEFGDVDFDHLLHVFYFVLPWNQRNLLGWIAEMATSIISACAYLIINGVFLTFFITICEYLRAFLEHYRTMIEQLDETLPNEVKVLLKKSIEFHIRTKKLFLRTTDVYSAFVLIQLICGIVVLSGCIFQLDLAIAHLDMSFFIMLVGMLVGGLNLFLYCYFGHIATDCFVRMADCTFESKWYNQPLQLQKYFLIIIRNAQQPTQYHGFGVAYLNLNTYCKMLRTVFSYYMMFKTLTSEL